MKFKRPMSVLITAALLLPLWAGDAFEEAQDRDAWGAAREIAREVLPDAAVPEPSATLLLFITIDGPGSARALSAGRDFARRHPEVSFEAMLLADLELMRQLSAGLTAANDPSLFARLKELDRVGIDLPMLGAVEPARRLGITHTPTFVLLKGSEAHRIAGIPDLEAFYEETQR